LTIVTVAPETVQTAVVDDANVGLSPEVADTVTSKVEEDHVFVPGSVKEIVFVPLATVIVCVADVSPVDAYVTVTEPGVAVIPRPSKVATPATAVVLPVPTTVPEESDAVTRLVAVVTLFPPASRISTTGWVVKALP
jgi:hypothetical protein